MMRTVLFEAAQVILVRSAKWSWLKAWAARTRLRLFLFVLLIPWWKGLGVRRAIFCLWYP